MTRIFYDDLKLNRAVLEIKYPKGYRYWDVCGKCILKLIEGSKEEMDFRELRSSQECAMSFKNDDLAEAAFGIHHMTLAVSCLKNIKPLMSKATLLVDIVRDTLEIDHYSRVGLRFWYVYPTKTKKDAESILDKINLLEVKAERFTGFGDKIDGLVPVINIKGDAFSVHMKVNSAAVSEEGRKAFGPKADEFAPEHCFLIDVDFYKEDVKPPSFVVSDFIHTCHKALRDNIKTLLNP